MNTEEHVRNIIAEIANQAGVVDLWDPESKEGHLDDLLRATPMPDGQVRVTWTLGHTPSAPELFPVSQLREHILCRLCLI